MATVANIWSTHSAGAWNTLIDDTKSDEVHRKTLIQLENFLEPLEATLNLPLIKRWEFYVYIQVIATTESAAFRIDSTIKACSRVIFGTLLKGQEDIQAGQDRLNEEAFDPAKISYSLDERAIDFDHCFDANNEDSTLTFLKRCAVLIKGQSSLSRGESESCVKIFHATKEALKHMKKIIDCQELATDSFYDKVYELIFEFQITSLEAKIDKLCLATTGRPGGSRGSSGAPSPAKSPEPTRLVTQASSKQTLQKVAYRLQVPGRGSPQPLVENSRQSEQPDTKKNPDNHEGTPLIAPPVELKKEEHYEEECFCILV